MQRGVPIESMSDLLAVSRHTIGCDVRVMKQRLARNRALLLPDGWVEIIRDPAKSCSMHGKLARLVSYQPWSNSVEVDLSPFGCAHIQLFESHDVRLLAPLEVIAKAAS